MNTGISSDGEALSSMDANAYYFHIEDMEIAIFMDSGTKYFGSHIADTVLLPLHSHPCYELFFVEQGTLRVFFEDREEYLEKNDVIIIPPKMEHTTFRDGEHTLRCNLNFHIKQNTLPVTVSLYDALNTAFSQPYTLLRNCPLLQDSLKNLHRCVIDQQPMFVSLYFHEFVARFFSILSLSAGQVRKTPLHLESGIMRLHRISGIINVAYANNITLEDLANRLNLSVRQTNRVIQEYYGMPFSELVLEQKMRYAVNLLIHSDLPIKEIARQSGYASIKGFYYSFKKKYKCLPSEYRRNHAAQRQCADSSQQG